MRHPLRAGVLLGVLGLLAAPACAHMEGPPGGPEDKTAPQLVSTRPDTMAKLRSYLGPVVFEFDEGISEQGIDTLVTVSPRTSAWVAEKSGRTVRVELRRGWEPNRVYQVTLSPGVRDLFGNQTRDPVRLVFSTGPEIPTNRIAGTVVDRTTLQPAPGVRVEAIHRPDSLVYATRADTAGAFAFEQVPEGEYRVRAFNDPNRDRALQPYESRDSALVRVTARDTVRVPRLAILAPDSTPPVAGSAQGEGTRIEVKFDDFLDPAQPLTPAQVTVTGPAGPVRVAAVTFVAPREAGDSADADSAGGARRDTARTGAARPARPAARDSAAARRDTARVRPSEPVPSRSVFITTALPLAPEATYTVRVTGVRNLLGLVGGGEAQLKTPRPAPPPAPRPAGQQTPPTGQRPPPAPVDTARPPAAPRPATSPAPRPQPPRP